MKKIFIFLFLFLFVGGAFAAGDNVTTSKSYVDAEIAQKQEIIPANSGTTQVITNTGTDGDIGTKDIYNSSNAYAGQSGALIDAGTMNTAVQNAIDSEFECVDNDCTLFNVRGTNVQKSPNLFDVSKVPTNNYMTNNGDGSVTLIGTSMTHYSNKKLSKLAPDLEVGKSYILNFTTTHQPTIYLNVPAREYWHRGSVKTITQSMLDSDVIFYTNPNETGFISNIQIEEGSAATPYQPYGNIYTPVGQ